MFGHTAVKRTDRRHINNPPVQQFDPRIGAEHARFRHAVVVPHAKTMLRLNQHALNLANPRGLRNRFQLLPSRRLAEDALRRLPEK